MDKRGGYREGAGRKKTLASDVVAELRDKLTNADFDKALEVLRFSMNQAEINLKQAVSSAIFVIEQKVGKAPASLYIDGDNSQLNNKGSFDINLLKPDDVVALSNLMRKYMVEQAPKNDTQPSQDNAGQEITSEESKG